MEQDKNIHRSTSRVLDILELVAENPSEYTLTDICSATHSPKAAFIQYYTL